MNWIYAMKIIQNETKQKIVNKIFNELKLKLLLSLIKSNMIRMCIRMYASSLHSSRIEWKGGVYIHYSYQYCLFLLYMKRAIFFFNFKYVFSKRGDFWAALCSTSQNFVKIINKSKHGWIFLPWSPFKMKENCTCCEKLKTRWFWFEITGESQLPTRPKLPTPP